MKVQVRSQVDIKREVCNLEDIKPVYKDMLSEPKFRNEHADYLFKTDYTYIKDRLLDVYTAQIWDNSSDVIEYLQKVNSHLFSVMKYVPGATNVHTSASEVLESHAGVCQDYAHLMIALLRYRGVPMRYVSGYIYCDDENSLRGDAATHAWVEAYLPEHGWIGLDPTNNVLVNAHHIKVAVGRDYKDVPPLKGTYRGGGQTLEVKVAVKPI